MGSGGAQEQGTPQWGRRREEGAKGQDWIGDPLAPWAGCEGLEGGTGGGSYGIGCGKRSPRQSPGARSPGAQDPRCRGRDPAGILREGEGSSRSRGRAGGECPGSRRRAGAESGAPGRGSARILGGKLGVRERLRGTLSSREARTPGPARLGPPAPRPSQPESDDPLAEQPQQPRASPRGRLPRPLPRERRTPLASTRLPPALQSVGGTGEGGRGREWTDRRMDEAGQGRVETSPRPVISQPRLLAVSWGAEKWGVVNSKGRGITRRRRGLLVQRRGFG